VQDLVSLLPILGIFLVFWLLIIRPASRRQKALREVQRQISLGDRVITGAGFFGTVASVEDDRFGLEIADGVVVTVARQSVVGLVDEADEADYADDADGAEGADQVDGADDTVDPTHASDPTAPPGDAAAQSGDEVDDPARGTRKEL
jgi:preprotein translocase subunit YajC